MGLGALAVPDLWSAPPAPPAFSVVLEDAAPAAPPQGRARNAAVPAPKPTAAPGAGAAAVPANARAVAPSVPVPAAPAAAGESGPAQESLPAALPGFAAAEPAPGTGSAASAVAGPVQDGAAGQDGPGHAQASGATLKALYAAIQKNLSYPPQARKRGLQGRVELSIAVDGAGRLERCDLARSSGSGILDAAALKLLAGLFPFPDRLGGAFDARLAVEYRLE